MTLTRHSIVYRIEDQARGPQIFTFRLRLTDPADLGKTLGLAEQLAMTMSVQSVRVARHLGHIDVEVALPRAFHRHLPAKSMKRKGGTWVALGQTAAGTPVHVDLTGNRACHALIAGQTGSGKTVTEQLVTWTLAQDNDPDTVRLILIDGKGGSAWWAFDHAAHLAHPIVTDPQEAVIVLAWCLTELDRRKAQRRTSPKLFIVIDEIRELLELGGDAVATAIQRITALGRELGIHVIAATQYPQVDAVGGSISKANFVLRLAGAVPDANVAYVATGVRKSGAEALQGNGDFLLTVGGGDVYRLQIALVGNREFGLIPRHETTPRLDLNSLDPARVAEVTSGLCTPDDVRADDLEPDHVAVALAHDRGINWLQDELSIGGNKATRLREFTQAVRNKLRAMNYAITPVQEEK
jgi:S-DNA-T family DNA segregation ATPase FtsK/SpoIIIE